MSTTVIPHPGEVKEDLVKDLNEGPTAMHQEGLGTVALMSAVFSPSQSSVLHVTPGGSSRSLGSGAPWEGSQFYRALSLALGAQMGWVL